MSVWVDRHALMMTGLKELSYEYIAVIGWMWYNQCEVRILITYSIDVLTALKEAGYSQSFLKNAGVLSSSTLTHLRRGELIRWESINAICGLLRCQPGDLFEWIPDKEEI